MFQKAFQDKIQMHALILVKNLYLKKLKRICKYSSLRNAAKYQVKIRNDTKCGNFVLKIDIK